MSNIPEELKKNLTIEDKLVQVIETLEYYELEYLSPLELAMSLVSKLEAAGLKLVEIEK